LRRAEFGGRRVRGLGLGARRPFPLGDQLDDENNDQDKGDACGAGKQFVQIAHRAVQQKKQLDSP
jgi:hypothetical protein